MHFRQWHCTKAARRHLFITNLWGPFLVHLKAESFHAVPKVCSHPVACILSYLPSQWPAHGNRSLHSMWCTQATPHPSIYWSLPDSTKIWEAFYLGCQITIDRLKPATLEKDSIPLTSDLSISTQRVPYSVPSNPLVACVNLLPDQPLSKLAALCINLLISMNMSQIGRGVLWQTEWWSRDSYIVLCNIPREGYINCNHVCMLCHSEIELYTANTAPLNAVELKRTVVWVHWPPKS